jgi:RNA recognition motif-containing protein
MKIFIGNLSTSADEKGLTNLFLPYGKVSNAMIVYDNYTHRSRGCGYVDMDDRSAGETAIIHLINSSC